MQGNDGGAREQARFSYRFRVRYAEVDPQAVVFNARYLEYADMVLNEFLRSRRIALAGADAFEVHVRKATVDFLKPILLDEEIDGYLRVSRMGTSSITTVIELCGIGETAPRATIELVYVHVDLATGAPAPVPPRFRQALK